MMKQLKILFFCMGILLNGFTLYSQTGDNDKLVLKLPEYEIKNPVIYSLLDSLDMLSEECIFCLLNKPYFYRFFITYETDTTIRIFADIEQYDLTIWEILKKENYTGFLYHNNILAIISLNCSIDDLFVTKSDSMRDFYYQKNIPITQKEWPIESASLRYQYSEGELNKNGVRRECSKKAHFFQKIQEGDTWELLLNECKCTEEILDYMDGKYVGELPKVGEYLIVEYNLTDNKEVTMNRISYETVYPVKKPFFYYYNRITPIYQNGFYIGILF